MYTSMANARFLGNVPPTDVSIIVAKLEPETDKKAIIRDIHALYPQLRAWDVRKLQQSTVSEILATSNMGMSFGTLVLFAMISGFFIIGLTLYSLDRVITGDLDETIDALTAYDQAARLAEMEQ